MTKLDLANDKFFKRKYNTPNSHLPFNEFILDCYLDYPPASYGKYIQNKIILDCCRNHVFGLKCVSDKNNNGDLKLIYPTYGRNFTTIYEENDKKYGLVTNFGSTYDYELNFELKCSFLGKNGHYALRNLRPYQKIDGGYIICLIDCENNFTPEFYVIESYVLFEHFKLSHMNGTKEQHIDSGFENYGITIEKYSYNHHILKKNNLLSGTKIEDLYSYLKIQFHNLEQKFMSCPKIRDFIVSGYKKVHNIKVTGEYIIKPSPLFYVP